MSPAKREDYTSPVLIERANAHAQQEWLITQGLAE
jgi:hypothetical protein